MSCQYADILGQPDKGFHKHIFGIALGDIIATMLAAYGISKYVGVTFITMFIILFILGTILHIIFCVDTQFVKLLKAIEPVFFVEK